jgi:hypothetical protein
VPPVEGCEPPDDHGSRHYRAISRQRAFRFHGRQRSVLVAACVQVVLSLDTVQRFMRSRGARPLARRPHSSGMRSNWSISAFDESSASVINSSLSGG